MLDERKLPDKQPEEMNNTADTTVSEENEMGFLSARYQQMNDEQVVEMCHQGDSEAEEYLLNKYKNFVRAKARSYFLIGADHEDIVQEGMIGLYKAIRDFKPEKLSSFRAFDNSISDLVISAWTFNKSPVVDARSATLCAINSS